MMSPVFRRDPLALKWAEWVRWGWDKRCPHCLSPDRPYRRGERGSGRYRCASPACRKDFNVRTGTVLASSRVPLKKWLLAAYLCHSAEAAISTNQLQELLKVTYKTAVFMRRRLGAISAHDAAQVTPVQKPNSYIRKAQIRHFEKQAVPFDQVLKLIFDRPSSLGAAPRKTI